MQQPWKRRWRMIGSLAVAVVALVLLVAAVHATNSKICSGINVDIDSPSNNFFVSENEVKQVINEQEEVEGQPIEKINLSLLEKRLRSDKWIASAELFFDKNHVLQVRVEEKEPVARIFSTTGSSYYIDSACMHLPLSKSLSARVPMFTNFPSDRNRLSRRDSALMASVKELAMFIQADDFWKAQVAQIDVTPKGFEIIPTIGNHVVVVGDGEDLQEKFDRLYTFYKQVWTKVGLNAYDKIDVQYKGQVVVTKKGAVPANVDTATARVALQNLLADMKASPDPSRGREKDTMKTSTTVSASASFVDKKVDAHKVVGGDAHNGKKEDVKQANDIKKQVANVKKNTEAKKEERRVPKAVMGKTK